MEALLKGVLVKVFVLFYGSKKELRRCIVVGKSSPLVEDLSPLFSFCEAHVVTSQSCIAFCKLVRLRLPRRHLPKALQLVGCSV